MLMPALFLLMFQSAQGAFPALAMDGPTTHLVWQDDREGNFEVYYSHSNADGSFTPRRNMSRTSGASDLPRVAAFRSVVSIVWSDATSGAYQIMLVQSEDGGSTFSAPRVISNGAMSAGPPDITSDEGRLFAAWDEIRDNEREIMFWRQGAAPVAIQGSKSGMLPAVAARGQRVVVAWNSESLTAQQLYAAYSDDGGETFSAPSLISGRQQRASSAALRLDPTGRAFLTWQDRTTGRSEIFFSVSDASGRTYSAPRQISASQGDSIFPTIELAGQDVIIVWSIRDAILSRRVSLQGQPSGPAQTVAEYGAPGPPRIASSGNATIVSWEETRAARITISRNLGPGVPVVN